MSKKFDMEEMLVKALNVKKVKNEKVTGKKEKEVSEITKQMKELHQMSRFLQDKLSTLENSLTEIKETSDDEEEEIFEDVDIEDDDEIIELPAPDPKERVGYEIMSLISPKKEPVDVEDDLDMESREILDIDEPFGDIAEDEDDDDLDEESRELLNIDESYLDEESKPSEFSFAGNERYVGHEMDDEPEDMIPEIDIKLEFKEEVVDPSDLSLPQDWKVRRSKGKLEGKFLFNSPDGKYFHSVYSAIQYMLDNDYGKQDVEIMKTNLRYEGWKEVEYMPYGWMICYYKPSNAFMYLSPDCKFFKSAKSVMEFMRNNHYNPKVIDDIKREMTESKKFTGKIKFKWQNGDHTLPEGWKSRKAKGTGKNAITVEFILSADGIQFKSRFEALHYMISNKYDQDKVNDLRAKLLISSEKWKISKFLPKDWIYRFKGDDATRDKHPTSTSITYFSREGQVFHSMKSIMDFMKTSMEYDDKDIDNCKEFLKNEVRFAEKKYQWQEGDDSVPAGWKVRVCDGETDREYILSPEGLPYRTRFVAIQDMYKRNFSQADIEIMKIKMIQYEKWEKSDLLPLGWMYKIISEGRTKDGKWYSSIHYLSSEGITFESMRTITEYLKSSNKYTQEDIEKCKEFLIDQKSCFKKYEWSEGDFSIPRGWKMRTSESENQWQYFLSPEGRQYRTRFVAIQDMFKRNYSSREIEEMKVLMMEHEGWEKSDLLPLGWIYKQIAEGFTKDNKWYSTLHYLSDDGITFESMKTITDHMKSSPKYTENDVIKCQEFLKDQKSVLKKYEWNKGDESLPKGWMMRNSETEGKWQFILSPEGRQYRTRFVAIQDMIKRNNTEEEVEEMRNKMVEYEGWERSDLLPHNWIFRVKWEGLGKDNKWTQNIGYLSREGVAYDSMRPVVLFMRSSENYTDTDVENCKEFIKKRNQDTQEERFEWREGNETVPEGWKMRISDGDAEMEWILSPDGKMYRSRVLAFEDMIKRGCKKEEVEIMRRKLIHEGWQKDNLFPEGWLLKKWEGKKRSRGKLNQDLKFLTKDGERLESFKTVIEYMNNKEDYTNDDVENVKKFKEQWSISLRRGGFEWEEGDETVPEGWKKRRGHGKTESEYILSPDGIQYRSRYNALMNLYKNGGDKNLIKEMRSKLTFEGWESISLIPKGWLFKRTWEGMISNGTFSTNTHYISIEGHLFESAKTAIEFMESKADYNETDVVNFKEFQTLLSKVTTKKREDWVENETVPSGWKTRVTAGATGREYVLRPDGQQFMSRINAMQHMIKENYDPNDIEEMKSKLGYEGWKEDEFLPSGWLFKIISEGFTKENKWYSSLHYLSKEGELFESMKTVIDFLQTSNIYTNEDVENCKSFLEEQKSCHKKYDWKEGDETILPGWKMRISESENEWQFYLSPEGRQYRSRFVAVQDMYKRGYNLDDIEAMKKLMMEYEGWERNSYLPRGWIYKNVCEGYTKDNKWYSTLHYLSSEGLVFQSMSTVIEHLKSTEIYTEEDVARCKEFLKEVKSADKKYDWSEGDETIPQGWKMRISVSENAWQFFLSPEGIQYRSRFVAIQDMFKRNFSVSEIEDMKEKMINFEGWERNKLLPKGWIFKVISEGFTKDNKWYSTLHYLSSEGEVFESMKTIIEHMKTTPSIYSEKDMENCKEFLISQKSCDKKYEWNKGDETIPKGWKMRVSNSEQQWQFYLSPEGRQYRTRYVALLDMVKRHVDQEQIEEMKEKMLGYEGWQRSDFLPYGWMYKVIWEGFTKDKEWTQTIRYLSREGTSLDSMKNVLEFINSGNGYSAADIENCKEFIIIQNSPEKKYKWYEAGDSLPAGWKTRIADGEMKMEFILSPEGRMYRSRYVACQDMIKRNYSSKDIDEMREKMISEEDWKRSDLLPHNWLYKIKWEGQVKDNKWSDNIGYFSREGITFESNKPAAEFMRSSPDYTEQDALDCKEFVKRRNQETQEFRFSWNQGDHTVPGGWKLRKTEDREFILSPEGRQYMTRVVALTDMIKRGYEETFVEEMRSKLRFEGWNTSQYLPEGWFWKMWEGETKKQKLDRNLFFVTREGARLESFKSVIEYMEASDIYTEVDIYKIKEYKKAEAIDLRRRGYDWLDGGETLPAGWMKRPGVGQHESERILSPEGEQYRSRFNALQNMVKNRRPLHEIDEMKNMLAYEGWESIELLPQGWLFKRIWEGQDSNGRTISNTHYISNEGLVFESVKSAIEYIESSSGYYNYEHVQKFKEFQNLLCKVTTRKREDWIEDETVPPGWKRRLIGASGKEFILRPDGKQFMTRCIALQHMVEENYSNQDIKAMRSKLCHEGWNEDNCLPEGWLYKVWEGKINGRTCRSYKFFSLEGTVFESMKTAIEFMEMCGYYSEESIENCRRFLKKENRNSYGERFQWETDDSSAPYGWKTRVTDGRKFFLMPDGNQFPSLFSAFQHMVKNDYLLSQINIVRGFLKQEGWEFDNQIPSGWQVKHKGHGSNWYIGRHGEFFENTEKALDFIGSNSEYTMEDLDNMREKMEGVERPKKAELVAPTSKASKSKLKLSWLEHETLPSGWRIRKVLDKNGVEVDHFMSPTGDMIAGRKGCWEYMKEYDYTSTDIEQILKFDWKTISNSIKSPKRKDDGVVNTQNKKSRLSQSESRDKRKHSDQEEGGNCKKKGSRSDNSETLDYLKKISNIHNLNSEGVLDIANRIL